MDRQAKTHRGKLAVRPGGRYVAYMLRRLIGRRSPPTTAEEPVPQAPGRAESPRRVTRADAPTLGEQIARVSLSRATHIRLDLKNCRFDDLNANQAAFVDCDFSYSVFDRAYFHGAKFENCRFVGCRFADSNLRGASFHICNFKYVTFQRTLIEPREILAVLPLEPNLRRDSLQNLRANAAEIGDYASQRLFVLAEVEAHRDHLTRVLRCSEDYYRLKYPGILDKLRAFAALTKLRVGGIIWGHGERPFRMLLSATVLLVALTLVNFLAVLPRVSWADTNSGSEILRYSVDMLLDANPQARFRGFLLVDYALIAMRYVYIGLFISVLSKSMSHR